MAAVVTAAALAGTTAVAAYFDAKYAIRKDVRDIRNAKRVMKLFNEAVEKDRLSLYYLFEASAKRCAKNECIWSREGIYTWTEAYDRVNQWAQWFLIQGVKPGDYVSFYLQNSPDFIFAWLGLWAIGASPAMINYNLAGKALLHCLKVPGSKLLLVDDDYDLKGRIEDERSTIEGELGTNIKIMDAQTFGEIRTLKASRPENSYRRGIKPNSPMCMFFTSGTTGLPKGVPFLVDRGYSVGISREAGMAKTVDDDRWYDCMPMYHGTGGVTAVTMMMTGVTMCLGKKFSTSKFWSEVHDSRATWFTYVGETARYLLAAPPSPLDKDHHVRAMYGNGLRPDVWTKFRDRFNVPEVVEFFASSEGVFQMVNYCRGDFLAGAVGYQGVIMRHLMRNVMVPVLIDQDTGAIARHPKDGFAYRQPYEVGGEMIVQVEDVHAFAGYFNNPEATNKKFERDVFQRGDLWYRSGDALSRDKHGRWHFKDRLGDTFRWRGENVSTAEVAEVLGRYPGVVEANVYGVALPSHDGRAGCAALYIDPNEKAAFDFRAFLSHARKHLPRYAVPVFVRLVKEMTPIHNNKQNKVPLREEGVDPTRVNPDDKILWVDEKGKGSNYVDFRPDNWEDLQQGRLQI